MYYRYVGLHVVVVKGQGLPHAVRVLGRDVKTRERKMQSSKSSKCRRRFLIYELSCREKGSAIVNDVS